MPNEKQARQEVCLSSEDVRTPPHKHEAGAAILESIQEKLKKLDVLEQINGRLLTIENTVGDMERGLKSMKADLQKVKTDLDLKADNATVEVLKDEIEEFQKQVKTEQLSLLQYTRESRGRRLHLLYTGFHYAAYGPRNDMWLRRAGASTSHAKQNAFCC